MRLCDRKTAHVVRGVMVARLSVEQVVGVRIPSEDLPNLYQRCCWGGNSQESNLTKRIRKLSRYVSMWPGEIRTSSGVLRW